RAVPRRRVRRLREQRSRHPEIAFFHALRSATRYSEHGVARRTEQGTHMERRPLVMFACLAVALLLLPRHALPGAKPDSVKAQVKQIKERISAELPKLEALYKPLHTNPELSFQEVETSLRLAKEMRELGFTVAEKVGKTGLVAVLENGKGPTVLVR